MAEPMIEARGLRKRYGERWALEGVDLDVSVGETVVLVGESGSGKSTLLRSLLGLVPLDAGELTVHGARVTPATVRGLRQRVGYVVQGGGLFPHLTARENVTLVARHLRRPMNETNRRVDELRELTRLPVDALDRFPRELSGGQAQRVSLIRALVLDPALLLLDEPLGALDPITRHELQEELRAIFERLGKTVVLVTHDLAEAAFFGGRIVLLREGRVVQAGPIEALVQQPADAFVTRFIRAHRPVPR